MDIVNENGNSRKTPIQISGRVIGEIVERKATFFVSDRHWYRAGNGYSLDAFIVEGLEGHVDAIEFLDRRSRRRETIPFERFAARSWATPDYGHGRKLVCDSRYYDSHYSTPVHLPTPIPAPTLFSMPSAVGFGTHG